MRIFNFINPVPPDFEKAIRVNVVTHDFSNNTSIYVQVAASFTMAVIGVVQVYTDNSISQDVITGLSIGLPVFAGFVAVLCQCISYFTKNKLEGLMRNGLAAGMFTQPGNAAIVENNLDALKYRLLD